MYCKRSGSAPRNQEPFSLGGNSTDLCKVKVKEHRFVGKSVVVPGADAKVSY